MAIGDTSGDSAIGAEAQTLVNQMGALDKNIAAYEIGGRAVASITGAVTPPVVAEFRSVAIERELREHGDDTVKAIELQRSFLQAVADDLQSELAAEQQEEEFKTVIEPYVSSNPLPSDWKALRASALTDGQTQSVAALNAAAATAENLKISFIAMAEGNGSGGLFASWRTTSIAWWHWSQRSQARRRPRRDATPAGKLEGLGADPWRMILKISRARR